MANSYVYITYGCFCILGCITSVCECIWTFWTSLTFTLLHFLPVSLYMHFVIGVCHKCHKCQIVTSVKLSKCHKSQIVTSVKLSKCHKCQIVTRVKGSQVSQVSKCHKGQSVTSVKVSLCFSEQQHHPRRCRVHHCVVRPSTRQIERNVAAFLEK
jgi:hypothetical protein